MTTYGSPKSFEEACRDLAADVLEPGEELEDEIREIVRHRDSYDDSRECARAVLAALAARLTESK